MAFNERYFNIIKYLFPKSRMFSIVKSENFNSFIRALTALPKDVKDYIGKIYLDIFPQTTRSIEKWEEVYGIISPNQDEDTRRQTISMRFKNKGGQSALYIQNMLRGNGFDVFVHENNPPVNPADVVDKEYSWILTNGFIPIETDERSVAISCGGDWRLGENKLFCGYFEKYLTINTEADIVKDIEEEDIPFCFFIGGDIIKDDEGKIRRIETAKVPESRMEYFKQLILSIKPAHSWAIMAVRNI